MDQPLALQGDKPEVTAKHIITSRMREIHQERVIKNLHTRLNNHVVLLNFKPDFTAMLSKKFSSYDVELEDQYRADCPFNPSEEPSN